MKIGELATESRFEMEQSMNPQNFEVMVTPQMLNNFFPLFQKGVRVICNTQCTLENLLNEQFGIEPEYIKNRITTIFLNNRAIDAVGKTMVNAGDSLALSASMPGLVGATMRRGGYLAAMRGAMTYHQDEIVENKKNSWISLKLFNLLLPELSPGFLKQGILINGVELKRFLKQQDENGCPIKYVPVNAADVSVILEETSCCCENDFLFKVYLKG